MRVVMTLVVRDEIDLIDHWFRYHLARGIDGFLVTDHSSVDGTREVIERYREKGVVAVTDESSGNWQQGAWVTRMARQAATELGADWVVHSDADEFWWPRGGSFHELLDAVPARFGVVRGLWRHFALVPESPEPFYRRMTVRRRSVSDFANPYHGQVKIAHRARATVEVSGGNHDAVGEGLLLLREWFPFEVFHYPLRDRRSTREKYVRKVSADAAHVTAARREAERNGRDALYDRHVVDEAALQEGLATGALIEDLRLRDAFDLLDQGAVVLPSWEPGLADDLDLAIDGDVTLERDAWVNLDRRARALQFRLDRLGEGLATRLAHRAARGGGAG